ncbi:N-acetyltransferase [Oceanospirillum sp. D5]|uniref:N-acetyltransferase n=2 Tax=Oceanospirillum sediminis TaxID=2760088 RepID=A0A839IQE0_9GAMM|nr:N-acetyltransferase [Oceanospirillum sediminis]
MTGLEYVSFEEIAPTDFLPILNKSSTRTHLIAHEVFDLESVNAWMQGKIAVDAMPGCQVRAIRIDHQLVGWCGIQLENDQYEIAIIIDDAHWGLGKTVFRDLMSWAKAFGHNTVFIHFLHTRPEYKFLRKLSKNVSQNEFMGHQFTSYELAVSASSR